MGTSGGFKQDGARGQQPEPDQGPAQSAPHGAAQSAHQGPQQGPIFDRAMRQVAEGDLPGFCAWLGVETEGEIGLRSGSFAAATLHADFLAQVRPGRLLHVEYQRAPEPDLAVRMLGYRAQIMRRYPGFAVTQVVIVLGDGFLQTCDDPQDGFRLGVRTVYLRDQPPEVLLTSTGLAPLAVLAAGDEERRARSLAEAFGVIKARGEPGPVQDYLLEAAAVLATIRLDRFTINKIREESGMTVESIADFYSGTDIGQELVRRGEERGEKRGAATMLEALLRDRFGDVDEGAAIAGALAQWPTPAAAVHAITSASDLAALREAEPQ